MFTKAQEIGIPASFVELRHEITHAELPSLVVLRRAVERAMTWLWDDFWRQQDVNPRHPGSTTTPHLSHAIETYRAQLRRLLEKWNRHETQAPPSSDDAGASHRSLEQTTIQLLRRHGHTHDNLNHLAQIFLEDGFLFPTTGPRERTRYSVFETWDPLLKTICAHHRSFLTLLVEKMTLGFTTAAGLEVLTDTYQECVFSWLDHLLTDKAWASTRKRSGVDGTNVIISCLRTPNRWTLRLLKLVLAQSSSEELAEMYSERIADMKKSMDIGEGSVEEDSSRAAEG